MSRGNLSNPACEGEKLFIQVMGKDHPVGHEIVIVDQYSAEPIGAFGKAETEDLPDPVSVLHKWCWEGVQRVDAQLHIATESGDPIRLPLLEWLYKNDRQPRFQDNIIQPVLPMALWQSTGQRDHQPLPSRSGYLYVFYQDQLWREIAVEANSETGQLEFRDVDLAAHRDDGHYHDDRRPTAGVALEEVWLPKRANNRHIDGGVRIAYSEVQWSAARLNYLQQDERGRQSRTQSTSLTGADSHPSPGRVYLLDDAEPQRLRVPLAEQQCANPVEVAQDMGGDYLSQLHERAAQELERFGDGGSAREAADEGIAAGRHHGEQPSPLYLQAAARLKALEEQLGDEEESDDDQSALWQGLDAAEDSLASARERNIPGLPLEDPLFAMRHVLSGCRASLAYLQNIPSLAAEEEFYESAALVNQTILKHHDQSGRTNELRRFADKADLRDTGELKRILRDAQRELARDQLDTYQSQLHRLLTSQEANAALADLFSLEGHDYLGAYALAADLLEALRDGAQHADALCEEPPLESTRPQQFLVNVLSDGSGYALHRMLFPSNDDTPLNAPLALPDDEDNPGDGRVRLKALSEQVQQDVPKEDDDVQLTETAYLAALSSAEELSLTSELKRWAGIVDLVLGRLAENANLLFEEGARQAVALPAARLARVGLSQLLGDLTLAERGSVRQDMVILGVRDHAGQLHNGLTENERRISTQGQHSQARQSFESTVRQSSGRTLNPNNARRLGNLADAVGDQHLVVLVADPDSEAARVSRRARAQLDVSSATDTLRLPYVIAVFELFNVRQELHRYQTQESGRQGAGVFSALFDLSIASMKTMEFYGERHNRLSQIRASAISRHFPLGDTLMRSQSTLFQAVGGQLRGTITALNFAGVAAGAISAALLAWDAWERFQHGNLGAGIALSIASASTLMVAGSTLVKSSALWLGLGPVGWIALGLSLAAIVASIWLTDNDIEEWLRLGPFGTTERYEWRSNPEAAFDRLVSLLANIRIRVEPIGSATAESIARNAEQRPAIGLLSFTEPMAYIERLMQQQALEAFPGSFANTRVVVNSNLPGLAPGWEQVAKFRFETVSERKHTHHKEGYSQWVEQGRELGGLTTPLFERATTDGREYYFWAPEAPSKTSTATRRNTHNLKVRVQWRKNSNSDLPRVLPAPSPTQEAPDDHMTPDFGRTDQPYWADETTHQDDGVNDG